MLIRRSWFVYPVLTACVVVGLGLGVSHLLESQYFDIKHLTVTGEVSKRGVEEVQNAVEQVVRDNLIVQALEPVRDSVKHLSWVKDAMVTRVWPDEIRVHVVHHQPFARWEDDRFVSETGIVFIPLEDAVSGSEQMPVISGATRFARQAVGLLKHFVESARAKKCHVDKLSVTSRQSWKVDLTMPKGRTLHIELGRSDNEGVLEERFDHVVDYYGYVCRELGRCPAVVDARYRNAFAAKWDVGPEPLSRQDEGEL